MCERLQALKARHVEALGAAQKALDTMIETLNTATDVRTAQMRFWMECGALVGLGATQCEVSVTRNVSDYELAASACQKYRPCRQQEPPGSEAAGRVS
jgi:hypothetical protein